MNNFDLEEVLRTASLPERPTEYWDTFPRQVLARLNARSSTRPARSPWGLRVVWGFGMAIAFLMIGFASGHWRGQREPHAFALLQNGRALREILTVFPNRVRAIEQDEHGVQLVLSDAPDVPVSAPIWIQIYDGKNRRAIVTFSGQQLEIAKERVEVLADAQGNVILVGEQIVWSSANPNRPTEGLRIRARSLANVM